MNLPSIPTPGELMETLNAADERALTQTVDYLTQQLRSEYVGHRLTISVSPIHERVARKVVESCFAAGWVCTYRHQAALDCRDSSATVFELHAR